jgi:transposase
MIASPGGVRVLVATRPVDFRKGMDGLAAVAKETLAQDPFSGTILVFRRMHPVKGHGVRSGGTC